MVKIFTNSVSDLSPSLAKEYDISLVPDTIIFDDKPLLNNIDITPAEFYELLGKNNKLPTSSHPNIYQYMDCFRQAQEYDEILCVTLTSLMSGSVSTANMAKAELQSTGFKPKITVYDSLQVSHGLAAMAIVAARLSKQGKSASEIVTFLDDYRTRLGVYFVMPSLENARKGGRIGVVKCFAADAMGIKPILCFSDGLVRDVGLVRGFKNAKEAVFKRYKNEADYTKEVCVFHANAYGEAMKMRDEILSVAPLAKVRIDWVGSVIGIYTGQGAVGIVFEKKL
ncbi:MAG: DegV family protein [Oscillospiraceae bacterium]